LPLNLGRGCPLLIQALRALRRATMPAEARPFRRSG